MRKPIIGILGNTYKTQPGLFSSAERMYVNSDYIESVLNNGGIPMAIPAVAMKADPEGILAVCDGILVPGGEDLNPWYYGEEPKPQIQTIRPEIDEAWFALGRAAKEMGITTIAGTMPDNNPPGIPLADEVCFMNIANPDEVAKKAAKLKLDGVATCCLDTGISALGKTCDSLGLTGLPEKAAIMCNDKSKMKKAFMEYGVSTAQYFEISSEEELKNALDKIKLPVIIKATDLQGSNGIYIAKTEKDAYDGFHAAMGLTKRSYCIVEEFIEGWEFGAQAFVYNNEVLFVMPHGDETYMSHTAVPVGHYVPLDCDENIHEQTEEAVKNAIKALGLNNCAVNVDLILRDNKVYVIELTGRVGANCLPELVEINFGIEYYKMIAAMAVGENPLEYWNKRRETSKAGLARMILETEKEGILEEIEFNGCKDEDVLEVTFFKHQGDRVRVFENSNDCVGQVIVQGNNQKQCQDTLNEVLKNIRIKLK